MPYTEDSARAVLHSEKACLPGAEIRVDMQLNKAGNSYPAKDLTVSMGHLCLPGHSWTTDGAKAIRLSFIHDLVIVNPNS